MSSMNLDDIIIIGINRSGPDSGEIDYAIRVDMIDRIVQIGKVQELLNVLDAVKQSCTMQDAIRKDKLLRDLGTL